MYKAIKIDSKKRTFEEVEIGNGLEDIYKQVECSMIEVATYLGTDVIYVDEEGLFGKIEYLFEVNGAHQPFVGNGLVVGTTSSGGSKSPSITIDELKKLVTFSYGKDYKGEEESDEQANG